MHSFFGVGIFKIDWLHCMDLGCAADWIGNLFSYLLPKFPGQNHQNKCSALFLRLQTYYSQNEVPGKYDNLTLKTFRQEKKGFKMRGKASEVRGLVGFAKELSEDDSLLSSASPVELTIKQGTKLLAQCYQCLTTGSDMQALAASCRQFCILWTALDTNHPNKAWRVKPKAHLLCELCEFTLDRPSETWTYRDEEFGGSLAGYSRLRGGNITPMSVGSTVLHKWIACNRLPILN